jgi:hypothetical protein
MPTRRRSQQETAPDDVPPESPAEKAQSGLYLGQGASAVAATLMDRGIDLNRWAKRPGQEPPEVPADVSEVPDRELMQLFTSLSRWTRYLMVQVSAAQVDESYAARQLAAATAKLKSGAPILIQEHPDLWEDVHADAKAYHVMIKALYSVTDRDYKLISREITRRTGRGAQEHRGNKAEEDE